MKHLHIISFNSFIFVFTTDISILTMFLQWIVKKINVMKTNYHIMHNNHSISTMPGAALISPLISLQGGGLFVYARLLLSGTVCSRKSNVSSSPVLGAGSIPAGCGYYELFCQPNSAQKKYFSSLDLRSSVQNKLYSSVFLRGLVRGERGLKAGPDSLSIDHIRSMSLSYLIKKCQQ